MGRCLFLLIGFLGLCGAAPPDEAKVDYRAEAQPTPSATAAIDNAPKPYNATKGDKQPDANDDSNLPTQTYLASGTEEPMDAAWTGVGVEAIGVFLSFISIVLVVIALRQTNKSLRLVMKDRATATRRAVAQSKETESAIAQATRSADAASDLVRKTTEVVALAAESNEIARQAHEERLSPHIGVSSAWFEIDEDFQPIAYVELKNFGPSPALDVETWYQIWVECFPLHDPLPRPSPGSVPMGKSAIGSGGTSDIRHPRGSPLNQISQQKILAGEAAIYVYGESSYRDVFGNRFISEFTLFSSGEDSVRRRRLSPYRDGNSVKRTPKDEYREENPKAN